MRPAIYGCHSVHFGMAFIWSSSMPTTGLLNTTNPTITHLAINSASGDPSKRHISITMGLTITCSSIGARVAHGIDSTYNIRVGRSTNITGPYLDRNGNNMLSGGGTLFLKTTGKYIAPGQIGILDENGNYYFGYHYLDANDNGVPTFDLEPLSWTADGWPAFTNDWSAAYHFQMEPATTTASIMVCSKTALPFSTTRCLAIARAQWNKSICNSARRRGQCPNVRRRFQMEWRRGLATRLRFRERNQQLRLFDPAGFHRLSSLYHNFRRDQR